VSSHAIAVHPPARPAFLALPAGAGPLVALVLASLLWGTADVAGKLALVAIPPATLAALRFGVALAIFWPLARWRGGTRAPIRITAPLGLHGTLPVLAGMAAWGTAALLPVAAVESWLTRPAAIGMGEVALVIYLGAGCSALTYALWGYALRHLEAGRAGTFDTLIPIVGIVAAVLVLQESPLVWHLVGGALVVTGVWLAVCEPRPIALPDGLRRAPAPRLEYPDGARVSASEALSG
jgi:drug/metabolite transporter (DMT)-like permease